MNDIMRMPLPDPADLRALLDAGQRIAICSHVRPDGDAIGAVLGLGLALRSRGKDVQCILADGVPGGFRFLKGAETVRRAMEGEVDLAIVVDCSDLLRTGAVLGERMPDLNIDHHVTNLNFARFNYVQPESVATCAILAELLPALGYELSVDVASALLAGIVTDTIGFRTSNVNPSAMRLSADLMERGADLPVIYTQALVGKSFAAARYWGQGLGKMQQEGGLVWTSLTLADRAAAAYPGNDDADLVNVLSSIDSDIAVIFVEQKGGRVKVSWRSKPGVDVSQIAYQFGGGGHAAAAGADITGTLAEVQEQVLAATRAVLAGIAQEGA